MNLARELRHALDAAVWARERLGFDPDPWQADVLRSGAPRMLLLASRQAGKSTVAAALALHVALYDPGALVLLVSPSLRQSQELFRKVLGHVATLGDAVELDEASKLAVTLASGSRIVSLPGSEATVRGYSAPRLVVLDEAARADDELYLALRPMLATSACGRLLLLSTPAGKRGVFWHEWAGGADWERIMVRADQCPRIAPDFLAAERRALGERAFAAEYECSFHDAVDAYFSADAIERAVTNDVAPLFGPLPTRGAVDATTVLPLFAAAGAS